MTALGVIPARGGSKGVPRKNLRLLDGEPLLVHTIRAALAAASLDRTVVSTDDAEIAAVAAAHGAEVVERPPELAADESPTEDALLHALDAVGGAFDYVVTLEPTSPLRSPATIDACLALARSRRAAAVLTVVETSSLVGRVADDGAFRYLEPGQPRRRQLREQLCRETGVAYVTAVDHLRRTRSVLADPVYAIVVPESEALDINSRLDLEVAEGILRGRRAGRGR